ncbi:FCD domain-containing protein [Aeromicrobium sp. SMF47]|uniref:GntR family transcriptional regulator n=1 Tax=Aeromicrobium yanjiei TaxID=2662028 RepID=UPI00129EA08D|nr:GntR family transcriptional regulator [Aeromicrobium yanjiei]MRJ75539.1 FCD domain-containing protein [Aeromicrobium yanjiei]
MASDDVAIPGSRTAYVLERLRADLRNGLINPGDQLRQVELARRYGVSATPVREALRVLEADGMIDYHTHRGATVRDYTPQMATDLYRMRAEMESLAVTVAMERMTPEVLAGIRIANEELLAATDSAASSAELSRLNKALHFAIYQATSPVMIECIEMLWSRFTPSVTLWSVSGFTTELRHDHEAILSAIEDGDAERASRAMHEHIMHACDLRATHAALRPAGPVSDAAGDGSPQAP